MPQPPRSVARLPPRASAATHPSPSRRRAPQSPRSSSSSRERCHRRYLPLDSLAPDRFSSHYPTNGFRHLAHSFIPLIFPNSQPRQKSRSCAPMATSDEQAKDYADFDARVKRTIYIDHLSPLVTKEVIKAALAQCANVVSSEFIVNYTIPYDIPSAALVELDDESQAKAAVDLMNDFPFIIGGMPRPVRATYAKPEMFRDRPLRPGLKMEFRWVKQGDPEYDGMNKLKILAKRQDAENMALIKNNLEEEQELAKQQQETLDGNYKKYDMLETIMQSGNIQNLAQHYKVNLSDT
ncbi:uncharacterized protein LOC100834153 isoform X1 [Brachypodium distachyon]|nr:uncharacterized protein LOC100834153 isoform X1 [Brachypodium distachyon]|eukprot:XP_010240658.2 uncharacterized protein LOC100834153 isoform X1 [Brachypodium distachyon]